MIIRAIIPSEAASVRDLIIRAFGQTDEADLCDALRASGDMALELVAEHKKKIVGHVALSRMVSPVGWLALAPLSTDPKMARRGIGSTLCQMAIQYANAPVVVLGEPEFYERIGFDFERSLCFKTPYPVNYTGLFAPDLDDLHPNATLKYASAFET
ncbi:putative acetyltransferase [Shimia gijangensis]|uniref:Putative acetyltransferase n=1 Tax=Shimia gijangensis TaxID=1470563 RepID=A0A1M6CTF5_9RHOB|nr:N-acetyltransferase [Shimia gijangensis]SHI64302.1 putative acetyltransferase [Shimia gijangensis]